MKRIAIFFFACAFMLANCSEKESSKNNVSSFDRSQYDITDMGGDLKKATKYNGENIAEQGYLKDGERTGSWVTYNPDGSVKTLTSYVNGSQNGPYIEYSRRAQIDYIANYENDELDGRVATYQNGRTLEVSRYKDGKLHGIREIYFKSGRETGKIQKTIEYKNGVIDGTMRYYNGEGEVKVKYTYEDGERIKGGITDQGNDQ